MSGSNRKRSNASSSASRIGPAEIARLRQGGAEALAYYEQHGLREVRSRALNIALSGLVPMAGMVFFGWSAPAMLLFMVADAAVTVLADLLRYIPARHIMAASHQRDHHAGTMLLIADGLEDGSGSYANRGDHPPAPGLLLLFGLASLIVLIPLMAAAAEPLGGASLREVALERNFLLAVALDAAWRLLQGVLEVVRARTTAEKDRHLLFMESGGVTMLCAGMLFLVWLPLILGTWGLYAMFSLLFLMRLAFGVFAYLWTPRAVASLTRRLREGDFAVSSSEVAR